ncbi:acyl transferase [Colletotrichum truncatum]|uniref:Acyl transferase n=1 Tax=Colletotrichum truncatum TaxID=5467 RepID=A0ACC3YEX6_COLTU|nr:acyl transferase [Colletotrichum truncatum]KAF6784921.1 acyl transferase [Colletotrichum truncatum]
MNLKRLGFFGQRAIGDPSVLTTAKRTSQTSRNPMMLPTQIFQVRPTGWATDPEDEYFPLSTLDYSVAQVWCNYALFFKLPSADLESQFRITNILRSGLERTISQVRQLSGTLTTHPSGSGLCWHKKRSGTVAFHAQWLDPVNANHKLLTFDDLESRHFLGSAMGDPEMWCVPGFLGGERPEATPAHRPRAAAYKATFIPGGMVFMMHHHHFSGDIMAWSGQLRQLASNCAAIYSSSSRTPGTPSPAFIPWDPASLDLSRVTKPDVPEPQRVTGPTPPQRHPAHRPSQRLLFHLPKSKIADLKKLATPPADDGTGRWASSYDAYMAYIWRVLSKHKTQLYNWDLTEPLLWGEAIDMRRRFRDPPVPRDMQGNVVFVAISNRSEVPQFTAEEVVSSAQFWKLAWYIRQLTNSATQESLDATLTALAPVRDKTTLFFRADAFHPTGSLSTDWRDARPCEVDFGFARPYAFRWPFETVQSNMWVTYPTRVNGAPAGEDEGTELSLPVEKEIVAALLEDPEWNRYFEFRGVEVDDGEVVIESGEVVDGKIKIDVETKIVETVAL